MSGEADSRLREFMKREAGPMHTELRRDLWPRMQARIGEPAPRVSWLDWALAAGALGWCVVYRETVVLILLHV